MAVYLQDDFVDPDNTALNAHTPAPVAGPGAVWEYVEAGAAPYIISTNQAIDGGTGVANPARVSQNILDDLIEILTATQRAGPLTFVMTGQVHLCMDELTIAANNGRITALVDSTNVEIQLWDDTGTNTRNSGPVAHSRNVDVQFELGMTKAGTRLEGYVQDVGGGNRVSVFMTLTAPEQTLYEDGAHRRTGISCTGTQAAHYRCDTLLVSDFEPVLPVGSTLLTLASGAPVVDIFNGLFPTGDALQTLASDVVVFQFNVTPIGSSFAGLLSGTVTFTGTFQEASPSAPPSADILTLPAPPQTYNQYDESQTRRQLELAASTENLRMDAIERILAQQVVTEGAIVQTNASDVFVVDLIPTPLDMPTDLLTVVPSRWSEPAEGTLRYTSDDFARLGLVLIFFEMQPAANNRTFIVDMLVNEVITRTLEFQTGTSGLKYPVSISDLLPYEVGTTDIRVEIRSLSSVSIEIFDFQIASADFFSTLGFDLGSPETRSVSQPAPIPSTSFLRELVRNLAALLPVASPVPVNQNRHRVSGDISVSALATGYAQQRGSGTVAISAQDTWTALDPATAITIKSSAWLQPTDAQLSLITDTIRVVTINMVMVLDTAAANQSFDFRLLVNGTPLGNPYTIPLTGNTPQEHTLSFIIELPVGLSTLSFETQNTVSPQDLDVSAFSMAVTDNLADG